MNCNQPAPARLRRSHRHIPEGFRFLLDGKPHPLQIPSIIEEVVSYLDLADLKSCRQVSRSWNQESLRNMKEKGKIVIQDEEKLIQFTKQFQYSSSGFINFELSGDIDLGSQCAINFFKIFGKSMKFVFFNRVRWRESELKDILFEMLPKLEVLAVEARAYSDRRLFPQDHPDKDAYKLPNIKILKLNVFSFITELTTPFLRDLLRACCNLEKVSSLRSEKRNPLPMQFIQYVCNEMNYDTADDVVNMPFASDIAIAEAIIESKDVMLHKLAFLDSNMRLRTHGIQQLAYRGFPLKQMDLTIMSDVSTESLHTLLSSVENTLTTFKLKFHPRCPAADEFAVPPMKNLSSLTLNGYRHSFKFLETLPSLKSLNLIRLYFSNALEREPISLKFHSKLQSLEVFEDFSPKCSRKTIQILVQLFPGIRSLKLENLTDLAMTTIFSGYPKLVQLDAMNGLYSDTSVTGIPQQVFDTLDDPYEMAVFDDLRQHESLASLKNLRSLFLGSPKISDLSVLYGVLQCHSLRKLHLLSNGVTDISLERLVDELDLNVLKTEHCYQLTRSVAKYAKEKMKSQKVEINEYHGPIKQSEIPKFMRRNGRVTVRVAQSEKAIVDKLLPVVPVAVASHNKIA